MEQTGNKKYDVVIIGGGPAGLSAGIYSARGRLKTLLLERMAVGGAIVYAGLVENYPGFLEGISGLDLADKMNRQAVKFGLEVMNAEVTALEIKGKEKEVRTSQGDFTAKAVIIAGGSERQLLNVPGEKEFTGRGVGYCALCDGFLFRDKTVAVAGGGNTAISEALELAKFAGKVYVIHRRDELRAVKILQERAFAEPKIEFVWSTVIESIEGDDVVRKLNLKNVATGKKSILAVDGVFVATGAKPATAYLKGLLSLDENGAIVTNEKMETGIPGIFAAGDIRSGSIRQVVSAVGDGAVAAVHAERYIAEHFQEAH